LEIHVCSEGKYVYVDIPNIGKIFWSKLTDAKQEIEFGDYCFDLSKAEVEKLNLYNLTPEEQIKRYIKDTEYYGKKVKYSNNKYKVFLAPPDYTTMKSPLI